MTCFDGDYFCRQEWANDSWEIIAYHLNMTGVVYLCHAVHAVCYKNLNVNDSLCNIQLLLEVAKFKPLLTQWNQSTSGSVNCHAYV